MKRGEIQRKTPIGRGTSTLKAKAPTPSTERKPAPGAKPKACRVCRAKFVPGSPLAVVCGVPCAIKHGKEVSVKQKQKAQRAERAADKVRLDSFKTYPQLIREAQTAFNQWIRMRDQLAGRNCISSGRPLDWSGNGVDSGHYRSIGSAPHLRFNEDNVHAQSKHDNQYKSGNAVDYRIGLIARIGLARVEALEADNTPRKWTHDELRGIKAHYAAKVRELKKEKA